MGTRSGAICRSHSSVEEQQLSSVAPLTGAPPGRAPQATVRSPPWVTIGRAQNGGAIWPTPAPGVTERSISRLIGISEDLDVARSLLGKVRTFVRTELTDQESEMFASLLAPGVSLAYAETGDDVTGFGLPGGGSSAGGDVDWRPGALADALEEALREGGVRVVGLDR